jgi:hypothetical protein
VGVDVSPDESGYWWLFLKKRKTNTLWECEKLEPVYWVHFFFTEQSEFLPLSGLRSTSEQNTTVSALGELIFYLRQTYTQDT